MASYFLDTSALVKRHVAETGHAWVRAVCDPSAGNTLFIAEIALVEAVATFSRMARETPLRLTTMECDQAIADFNARFLRQYIII